MIKKVILIPNKILSKKIVFFWKYIELNNKMK